MPNNLEILAKDLTDIATKIGVASNAININIGIRRNGSVESAEIQQLAEDFEKHFSGMVTRIVKRGTPEYPFQEEIHIGGVMFFALLPAESDENAVLPE